MSFKTFISIFCVLSCLTYLAGCRDDSPTNPSLAPAVSGTSNESATSPQSGQSQNSNCDNTKVLSNEDFLRAIEESNISALSNHINCGGEGNMSDLFIAAINNSIEVVKLFLDSGVDFDKKNDALRGAATRSHAEVVKLLLDSGADVNSKYPHNGNTALHDVGIVFDLSLLGNVVETARILIEAGADIDAKNNSGETPFQTLLSEDIHKLIVEKTADRINVDQKNKVGATPLFYAQNGEVARKLIERGADVDFKIVSDDGIEVSVLSQHSSVSEDRRLEVVRALLEAGVNVNAINSKSGSTSLMMAAFQGNLEIVKLLVEKMEISMINARTISFGETALTFAIENGHQEVVEFLRSVGAEI